MFVIIEGTDASGKATQSKLLESRLTFTTPTKLFSFPRYDTELGRLILKHLKKEVSLSGATAVEDATMFQCLMAADRYDAALEMQSLLSRGHNIVCDRWWQSGFAYGCSDGVDPPFLLALHDQLPKPDLCIFIDVPIAEAARRRPQARDRYESDKEKLEKIRQTYLDFWYLMHNRMVIPLENENRRSKYVVVNGVGTVEEVHDRIVSEILNL